MKTNRNSQLALITVMVSPIKVKMRFSKLPLFVMAFLLGIFSNCVPLQWTAQVVSLRVWAQTQSDGKAEAERLLNLCREHLSKNQLEAAIQSCQQAVTAHQQIKDRIGEAKSTVNLGIAHVRASQYEQAIPILQSASELAREAGERRGEAVALVNLGSAYDSLAQYQKAIEYHQQSLTIFKDIGDHEGEAASLTGLGNAYYSQAQYQKAIDNFQQSLAISKDIDDHEGEAVSLGSLGNAYYSRGQYQKAIEYYQQSLTIFKEIGDRDGESASLTGLGNAHKDLGQYEKAIEYHQQSLNISKEIGDRQGKANSLGNLGNAYQSLGEYPKANEYYQQSLAIQQEIGDRQGKANSLNNLGVVYESRREYSKAIEYHEESLALARQMGDRNGEAKSLNNLGNVYRSLGEYPKAIEYYQQSLAIKKEIGDLQGEAASLGNLGSVYRDLGQYQKAIDYHQQSLDIFKDIGVRQGEALSLNNLGSAYTFLGQYSKAVYYLLQSLTIFKEISDRDGEAFSLMNLGIAYDILGKYQKAVDYYQQSFAIFQDIGNRNGEARSLDNLGLAYNSLGQDQKAIESHQQSLAIKKEIGDRQGEANSLNNLGLIYNKLGQYVDASKTLFNAIEVLELLRSRDLVDMDKISLFETQAKSYILLQQALVAQNKTDEALEISERGRARAFVELLASRLANNSDQSSIKPPTIQQIQQIAQQQNATLVEYSLVLDKIYCWVIKPTGEVIFRSVESASLATPQALEKLVQKTQQELASQVGSSRSPAAPTYAPGDLVRLKDDAQSGLQEPWQVINFDPNNQLLTLTHLQFAEGVEIPRPSSDISAKVESYVSISPNLRQLHQLLIEPIADQLPTDPNKPVIFIPHRELFLVPFNALQDGQGKYLIEKHTILTAPAIQVLELTRQQKNARRQEKLGQPLVMGNPTMPTIPFTEPPQQLASLPGAETEAKAIAQQLGTQPILGDRATKATLIPQMEKAGIIHFATHGLLDDYKQLGTPGAIALAPTDEKQDPLSGFLTSGDIFEMKLKADLVVLSACNTGQGRITGDGVIGLSRSFISAGVPSIIVSLWSAPDAPTAELMQRFYENKKTMNKAQALRQAMLETMKTYPKPVDWAAFTLMGEAE